MAKIFIRNIFKDDELFIQAALKFGHSIIGNISDNDTSEITSFREQFPQVQLLHTTTAFQKNKSFWLSAVINMLQIQIFKFIHFPNKEFKNSRYIHFNFLTIILGLIIPKLRPHLRFQNKNWDKDLYLKELADAHLPVPKTYGTLKDNQEPDTRLFNSIQYPCVCKPSSCSGGYGVLLANGEDDIKRLYAYENDPTQLTPMSHFFRNKTSKGVRNYIYNSHALGGRYLFQEYIPGQVFSISALFSENKISSHFCYEIHSADSTYFAEQGFSWPINKNIENEILLIVSKMALVLNYPEGPLMADFVYHSSRGLFIIDASPRSSLTAAKLSFLAYKDNWHAECLALGNPLQTPKNPGRAVFWQRLPLPKGHYKSIQYPDFSDQDVIDCNLLVQADSFVHEPRTDRQMAQRGDFATTGDTAQDAQSKWNSLFKQIKWQLNH